MAEALTGIVAPGPQSLTVAVCAPFASAFVYQVYWKGASAIFP